MIILDTNVVSEPMRAQGHPAVLEWLDQHAVETLFLTATSLSELLLGIEVLPAGKRKKGLSQALLKLVDKLFADRVLAFDQAAASVFATIVGQARQRGHAISVADGQIAAIAKHHGYTVATRDTAPFIAAGVAVVNPWLAPR